MYIQDIFSAEQSGHIAALTPKNKSNGDSGNSTGLPASWGGDTVSISPEARVAQQDDLAGKVEDEQCPEKALFAEYMAKARGEKTTPPEEQLEALQNKLTQLQAKLGQVASSESLSEQEKQSQMSALEGQIAEVISQIGNLQTEMAKKAIEFFV